MAEILRYVNTASTGGDGTTNNESGGTAAFASLSAWEAATQTDLVSAGDSARVLCGTGSGTAADTGPVTVAGWTTSATSTITIEANTGDEATSVWSTSKYRISGNGNALLDWDNNYITTRRIQIECTGGSFQRTYLGTSYTHHTFEGCFVYMHNAAPTTTALKVAFSNNTGASTVVMRNNIIVMIYGGSTPLTGSFSALNFSSSQAACENNTLYMSVPAGSTLPFLGYGIGSWFDPMRNNLVYVNGYQDDPNFTALYGQNAPVDDTNNSTNHPASRTIGLNSPSYTEQRFFFKDPEGLDFGLYWDDPGAAGKGADLSSSFTTDINGNTRTTPWDIGAVIADPTPTTGTFIRPTLKVS